MSRTLFSLAGFQVITIGRFWVIAEAPTADRTQDAILRYGMNGKSTEGRQQSRKSSELTKAVLHLAALSRTYRGCSKRVYRSSRKRLNSLSENFGFRWFARYTF